MNREIIKKLIGDKMYHKINNKRFISRLSKVNPQYPDLLKKNETFKNKHKGQRCFVLGNGPSLNSQDLSLLENEVVFTVNRISRHKDFKKIKTNYHFWADPAFLHLDLSNDGDMELFDKMKGVNTENNKPVCFYELEAYDMIKYTGLDKELDIAYFKYGEPFCDILNCEIDLSARMPSFHSVVQYAIATAIYMGFSEIYFLGCESTSILPIINIRLNESLKNDYAYEVTENEVARMKNKAEKVSFEQELFSFYKVISDYRLLNSYCIQHGIKLYNCTLGGLVEDVPRKKFEQLFEAK